MNVCESFSFHTAVNVILHSIALDKKCEQALFLHLSLTIDKLTLKWEVAVFMAVLWNLVIIGLSFQQFERE